MNANCTLNLNEARQLLDLPKRSRCSKADVEAAYVRQMKHWTGIVNSALSLTERERASEAIVLLREAKALCLKDHGTSGGRPTTQKHKASPPPLPAPRPQRTPCHAQKLRTAWRTVTRIWRVLVCFCRAAFITLRTMFRSINEIVHRLEAAGIPKAVSILALSVAVFGLFHGCNPQPK